MQGFASRLICLILASVLAVFFVGCGAHSPKKTEKKRIQALILGSRAFATDNGGHYPGALSDLHPKYIGLISGFYSPRLTKTDKIQPFYYRPGLKVGAKVDEPIIVSPNSIKGKVNVGYLGGFIRQMTVGEAKKIVSNPDWVQSAPGLAESSAAKR